MEEFNESKQCDKAYIIDPRQAENLLKTTFRVLVHHTNAPEVVCLTGNCYELGEWAPNKLLYLKNEEGTSFWSVTINIPKNCHIFYRYCICITSANQDQAIVRRWETHLNPRELVNGCLSNSEGFDVFGVYQGDTKIDNGWLTLGSVLQLKFPENSLVFEKNVPDNTLSIKLSVLNYQSRVRESNESDPVCIIEVANIYSENSKFESQNEYGCCVQTGSYLIFNVTMLETQDCTYVVEFYKHKSSLGKPELLASSFIMPHILHNSQGYLQLPVLCSTNHRPLGLLNAEYLKVLPMSVSVCNMKESFSSHWSQLWAGLDVGHRGSGSSFKDDGNHTIRENTIASFKKAAENGADMLEFDIQLTKNLVPIVYHDFHVCIAPKIKHEVDLSEMFEVPLMDLTLEQLEKLKVYHVVEGRDKETRFFDENLEDHQPFPLLSKVLTAIDQNVGFNIEIKWSLKLEDGSSDLVNPIDMNLYIDKILEVVLQTDKQRKIVFSCFDPDICTMLRLKQNIYPTMFLTQGVTNRYPKLFDSRCNSIQSAVRHAINANLLGVVVHTEDLLRDSSQVKLVIDAGLIIFCWGNENNNVDTINYLKKLGLHGVIFDKMDQYSTKEKKESVFLLEAQESGKNRQIS